MLSQSGSPAGYYSLFSNNGGVFFLGKSGNSSGRSRCVKHRRNPLCAQARTYADTSLLPCIYSGVGEWRPFFCGEPQELSGPADSMFARATRASWRGFLLRRLICALWQNNPPSNHGMPGPPICPPRTTHRPLSRLASIIKCTCLMQGSRSQGAAHREGKTDTDANRNGRNPVVPIAANLGWDKRSRIHV